MKKVEIHHVLNGKTVLSTIRGASDKEAQGVVARLARLRANDGCVNGDNFAIPARSIELIKVVDE